MVFKMGLHIGINASYVNTMVLYFEFVSYRVVLVWNGGNDLVANVA